MEARLAIYEKSGYSDFPRKSQNMSQSHQLKLCLIAAVYGVVQVSSCHAPRPGPKLIEADGVTYTACGGALWLRNDGNLKDPSTMNYDVQFQDAQGLNHHLKMVRMLKVTDLPDDTPLCNSSPSSRVSGPR